MSKYGTGFAEAFLAEVLRRSMAPWESLARIKAPPGSLQNQVILMKPKRRVRRRGL